MALKFTDKIPTDRLTREFDWTAALKEGDTIVTSPPPVVEVDGDELTVEGALVVGGLSVVTMIDGGEAEQTYTLSCTVETASGERITRTATQKVKAKL